MVGRGDLVIPESRLLRWLKVTEREGRVVSSASNRVCGEWMSRRNCPSGACGNADWTGSPQPNTRHSPTPRPPTGTTQPDWGQSHPSDATDLWA
jgi:hypothetical protein